MVEPGSRRRSENCEAYSETLFINVNFCEPVSRNWPLRARLASTTTLRCRNRRGAYCTSSMITGDGWRLRKFCGSFSACSASVGRSRETNPYFGNSRSRVEVLPVWRAPVSTTTGRVRTDRCSLGSISRGIHTCIIYDRIAYFAMPSHRRAQTGQSNAETQKTPGLISRGRYSFADPSAVTYHDPDHSLSEERSGRVLIVAHADRLPISSLSYGAKGNSIQAAFPAQRFTWTSISLRHTARAQSCAPPLVRPADPQSS